MGSSAKKKAEKKKDFQKQKLKVGKQRPKATNVTDTSFRSKRIVLREQSLATHAPSQATQINHHLSVLGSRVESQRKDSLSFVATALASRAEDESLPRSAGDLLDKLLPLSLDGSDGVRAQLLRALQALHPSEVKSHSYALKIMLYVRAGMTHLAAGIRDTSMDILSWGLQCMPEHLVESEGGWIKTLRIFAVMLSWPSDGGDSASRQKASQIGSSSRLGVKMLSVLGQYMRAGLFMLRPPLRTPEPYPYFPLSHVEQHWAPGDGYPYLFQGGRTEDTEMVRDRDERLRLFEKKLRGCFAAGLQRARNEGGQLGRAAAQVEAVIEEGVADFEDPQAYVDALLSKFGFLQK